MELIFTFWKVFILLLLLHYLLFQARLIFNRSRKGKFRGGVSVIICARNEAENLRVNLPKILEQDYHEFEVLVVNDRSTDVTVAILDELQKKYHHLRVVATPKVVELSGKKAALKTGLTHASHEVVLLTDADCRPAGKFWISQMVSQQDEKEIILGFGGYEREKGWLNRLVRLETLQTAINYYALAHSSIPYMGVGRNLCYRKELFHGSSQFKGHATLVSGDDDLLIGEIAQDRNTTTQWNPESFTWSVAPKRLQQWWRQKRRHLSTSAYYRFLPKIILLTHGLAQLGFYLLLIPLMIYFYDQLWLWIWVLLKFAVQLLIWIPVAKRFRCVEVLWLLPLWEMILTLFTVVIHLQNRIFGASKRWN